MMRPPGPSSTRARLSALRVLGLVIAAGMAPGGASAAVCPRCGWAPPRTTTVLTVDAGSDLITVLRQLRPDTTVLFEDGTYHLRGALQVQVPGVVLRGKGGDRAKVVLQGGAIGEQQVRVAIAVEAPQVTLADMTIGRVGWHGVQVRGEARASGAVLHNLRILETGQQLVKGSLGPDGAAADHGLVACSSLEYLDHAPSNYTNGVDVLGGTGWVVRDNLLYRIRGPREAGWRAGPAVLFWRGARDTIIERNLVLDCSRGIALGLDVDKGDSARGGAARFDHQRGTIRNNLVVNLNSWADEGIEVGASGDVRIEHNTVLVEGRVPWSISLRFPSTTGQVRNNLCNRPIVLRDGARAELRANIIDARRDWFVDPARGDLRLARGDLAAIDAGIATSDLDQDFARRPRVSGKAPDAGAFEFAVTDGRTPE